VKLHNERLHCDIVDDNLKSYIGPINVLKHRIPYFIMRFSIGGRIGCCTPPRLCLSVCPPACPCLQITRNRQSCRKFIFIGDI